MLARSTRRRSSSIWASKCVACRRLVAASRDAHGVYALSSPTAMPIFPTAHTQEPEEESESEETKAARLEEEERMRLEDPSQGV